MQTIPLNKLDLSDSNVRKTSNPAADEQLSYDIEGHGLLQNLIVTKGSKRGRFAVIAGGRRLRAMQMIVQRGAWPAEREVNCEVIDGADHDIGEVSLAENFSRLAMLGHVSRVSFDRKDYRAVCLFQAARSAYPKSWRRAAWNKHLRGGCGILRCGISVASPSRGRLVDLLARLSAQHI